MHSDPVIYTDFQATAELRRQARQSPDKALETVARQFEALFVQMMLGSMREASLGSGLFDSDQSKLYQEMYDKQLANALSAQGHGIGIAEMLVRQLRQQVASVPPGSEPAYAVPERRADTFALAEAPTATAEPPFATPEEFVQRLWPEAERAARQIGAAPEALLAQAALETGWGKAVIRRPGGTSSHNLFNIKADRRWEGDRVAKQTLEYRDGVALQERAEFRAYGSFAESFDDYVRFLSSNPRYRTALEQVDDTEAFLHGLQRAGYATDPRYAEKVTEIMQRGTFARTVSALKVPGEKTLIG